MELQNLHMYWKRKALTHTIVYVHAFFYYLTLKSVNLIKDKNDLGIFIIIFMQRWRRQRLLAQFLTSKTHSSFFKNRSYESLFYWRDFLSNVVLKFSINWTSVTLNKTKINLPRIGWSSSSYYFFGLIILKYCQRLSFNFTCSHNPESLPKIVWK